MDLLYDTYLYPLQSYNKNKIFFIVRMRPYEKTLSCYIVYWLLRILIPFLVKHILMRMP